MSKKLSLIKTGPPPAGDLAHLASETRSWVEDVEAEFELLGHHRRLLIAAAEAWDRSVAAREAIAEHGLTFRDRFGQPRERPEVAIASRAAGDFRLLLRELGLDLPGPGDYRAPRVGGS
jgi:phage terminase small subunit